ncbi:MAG: cytoplasmic tRNA 2-thiolation protein 2 [Watsoniomyces obsoletus]|nr:MAG: cytoplasmic tRNA 2-thiolation protein 2 [Watsoniomyces obsoletus]
MSIMSKSQEDDIKSHQNAFKDFFSSLSSATSKADILQKLKVRLLVRVAEEANCKGILWGDTATKLAEKTLAETAKGRGFSLPWQISDGPSPFGIPFYYPLRDLLRKEIISFSGLVTPSLTPLIVNQDGQDTVSASSKHNSLDVLMGQYFAPVEENFPNIVANVVRTSGKLQANRDIKGSQKCSLCGIYQEAEVDAKRVTNTEPSSTTKFFDLLSVQDTSAGFCHGCERALSSTP